MKLISIEKSKPLTYSGSHFHDSLEIILNLEGEGVMTVGDSEFDFSVGDVVCIPPGVPHTKRAKNIFSDIFIVMNCFDLKPRTLVTFSDHDSSVKNLLSMIHSIYHKKERNYQIITEQLASALEQLVIGRTQTDRRPDSRTSAVASIIVEHFSEPDFDVYKFLERLGYCTDHIRRIFTKDIGMSPLEYMTSVRIDHAKKLLRENHRLHYTITEIAIASGYSDISYFSRVFKKHTGMSPKAYLAHHCEPNEL